MVIYSRHNHDNNSLPTVSIVTELIQYQISFNVNVELGNVVFISLVKLICRVCEREPAADQ